MFNSEFEGQDAFYDDFLARIDSSLSKADLLADNNDGVIGGNILEFKLAIANLNKTLSQTLRYLSAMRIKGKPIPANIVLISLNDAVAYVYHSSSYLADIEQVYVGPSSSGIEGFSAGPYIKKLLYGENTADAESLVQILRTKDYTKIHIDENCIVGWANTYYRLNPGAHKSDFIGDHTGKVHITGEIREPDILKEFIIPYTGATNIRFQYLMDTLNDVLQKKNLGAFYTPPLYAQKAHELLYKAIERVPEGNDYIILDRCAGTGNLYEGLPPEILEHVVTSTYEYYEYKVLLELYGDKVRAIIPPIELETTFIGGGLVRGSDALSKEFIEHEIIRRYVDDPKCTIIIFENPPYAETTSAEHQRQGAGARSSVWKNSFVVTEMREALRGKTKGSPVNDMGNAFIWSAFQYYLRQPTDSLVVFSPVKYWKAQHLIKKKFLGGYAFNRRHFHTNIDACIMVALWCNEDDAETDELNLVGFDVVDGQLTQHPEALPVRRISSNYSNTYYDKRPIENAICDGILCALNGTEKPEGRNPNRLQSNDIVGYLVSHSSGFDNPDLDSSLLVAARYDGNGFFLRKDNFLEKLPMFCASRYIRYNHSWTERARIMKSGDGADHFKRDIASGKLSQWLLKCLLFTVAEPQNHMRSLHGSDGRYYRNELCLDTTNGQTLASKELKKLVKDEHEKKIISQLRKILSAAKETRNYDPTLTYGLYQISSELNTFRAVELPGGKIEQQPDYPELNGHITSLRHLVKEYYLSEIVPKLFEYEFLK